MCPVSTCQPNQDTGFLDQHMCILCTVNVSVRIVSSVSANQRGPTRMYVAVKNSRVRKENFEERAYTVGRVQRLGSLAQGASCLGVENGCMQLLSLMHLPKV